MMCNVENRGTGLVWRLAPVDNSVEGRENCSERNWGKFLLLFKTPEVI